MKESTIRVLKKLEKRSMLEKSRLVITQPERRMLAITPNTARFFHSLLISVKAKRILELGTSTGYSTLWLVDAALKNRKNPLVVTVENNPIKIEMAVRNFKRAGVSGFIRTRHAKILEVLKNMHGTPAFDFVLIDADKENISEYFDLVLPLVKVGGIIATDNVLYPKKYRKFMKKYTNHIRGMANVVSGTIPIGYGEEISIKIS